MLWAYYMAIQSGQMIHVSNVKPKISKQFQCDNREKIHTYYNYTSTALQQYYSTKETIIIYYLIYLFIFWNQIISD